MLDILKRNLEAFAAGKWDACRAGLDEHAIYEEPGRTFASRAPTESSTCSSAGGVRSRT